ncbi:DUF1624 domain-containing protein [Fibrella sp. WM1]|uniref:DUF1624 domain-containing protein n=1 Tax=Fibrella musci TaxID=3242485 RepID=UPI00352119C0
MHRISSIDITRGLVMVIMALDHVRDLLHLPALTQNPTDLATTTPELFFTRWITHLCAPTFVFLSGTSAYLSLQRRSGATARGAARRFLLKRGLVLLLLELTLINFAFWFDIQFRTIMLQVIFAIGGGLVVLSLLARLPVRWVGVLGAVIVAGHLLVPNLPPSTPQGGQVIWSVLFRPNLFTISPAFSMLVAYPLVPWLGLMLVGYATGPLFERPLAQRRRLLWQVGLGTLAGFVLLRLFNGYGDPAPWAVQPTGLFTLLSFLNVSKYPPSLLYGLLMIGLMLLILALAEGADNAFTRWLQVYGSVPMFYYILHWYLVHISMVVMVLIQGYSLSQLPIGTLSFGRPPGAGVSLPVVYGVWIGLVLVLYPLCRWYSRYKTTHPEVSWLRYV